MSAATRLRRLIEAAEIVVFEQGEHVSFANCGLPYHVGLMIPDESDLVLQTPESLSSRFNLDVRVKTRVEEIDRIGKRVRALDLKTGREYWESFEKLIISTGAKTRKLPITGIERALELRDVADAAGMKKIIDSGSVKTAAIIGAGFIGIELAENLAIRGVKTEIVEFQKQILPVFDPEMIEPMQALLEEHGIRLQLGSRVSEISESEIHLEDGRVLPADLVIAAPGVVADNELAVNCGLEIGQQGGIVVDDQQRTSDADIFAVGDVAEKTSKFSEAGTMVWLANLANRHGRLAADVIAGLPTRRRLTQATGIIGAFGLTAALTGLTEQLASRLGIKHSVIHLHPGSHAGYFPGAERISLKLVIESDTGKLLGAQAVGRDGADKRIDILATAIFAGLEATDLMDLELAYAPAYGSAKDAVNQAGYLADNVLAGRTALVQWHELEAETNAGAILVDVRTAEESAADSIPGSVHIPLDALRERWQELAGRVVIVHCAVGQRGHTATQLLKAKGVNVRNLDGGFFTWQAGTDAMRRLEVNQLN
jgi:NADPH-dependent 2,4-dienoyl-CoA reductase/sulfur reductase-like enzyme/rhodanese-related sulfurtransferase